MALAVIESSIRAEIDDANLNYEGTDEELAEYIAALERALDALGAVST